MERFLGRLVSGWLEGRGGDGAHVGQRAELAGGAGLHEHVAERGGLDRARDHLAAGHVGGQLVQERVLHAAADHVDRADLAPRRGLEPLQHELVLVRERDVDRAHDLAARRARPVDLGDQRRHVAAAQEALVVDVEDLAGGVARLALQRREVRVPDARALLLEPQAHDVLEQPDRAVDAALVGQLGIGEHRARQLEAEQRPRAGREHGVVLGAQRRGDVGRSGVVRGHGVDGRVDLVVRRARAPAATPGSTSAPNGRAGSPIRSISSSAHSPVRASSSPVVDAFVRSLASSPDSQYASRSGTSAIAAASRTRSSTSSW